MKKRRSKRIFKLIILLVLVGILFKFIYSKFNKEDKLYTENNNVIENNNNNTNDNNDEQENNYNVLDDTPKTYDAVSMLQYEEGEIIDRLKEFAKKDKRINNIIAKYDSYPEKLMEGLSRNIELTDYVVNYLEKKDQVYSDNIGSVEKGVFPNLYQWDERWGYGKYGTSSVAVSGCGPTSLAIAIAGLTGDNSITPYDVAKMAEEKGYYKNDSGTTWDLIREGPRNYGLQSKELPLSESVIVGALKKGHPVICNMRKGDFTINGHYIVLVGVSDNKFKINDPNSQLRSSMLWEFERIKDQIKNLWEIYE